MSDDEVFITAAFTYTGEKAKKIVQSQAQQRSTLERHDSDANFTSPSKSASSFSLGNTASSKGGKNATIKKIKTVDDEALQILREDLNELGIPQPSTGNILVTKEGTVEFYWYTTRKNLLYRVLNMKLSSRSSTSFLRNEPEVLRKLSISHIELDDESILPGRPTPLQDRVLRGVPAVTATRVQKNPNGKRLRRDSDTSSASSAPYQSRNYLSGFDTHITPSSRTQTQPVSKPYSRAYSRPDDSLPADSNKNHYSSPHSSNVSDSRNNPDSSSYSQSPYKRFRPSSPSSSYPADSTPSRRRHITDEKPYSSFRDKQKRHERDENHVAREREFHGSDGRKYYKNWSLDLRGKQGKHDTYTDSRYDSAGTNHNYRGELSSPAIYSPTSTVNDRDDHHTSPWSSNSRKGHLNSSSPNTPGGYLKSRISSYVPPSPTIPIKEEPSESLLSRMAVPSGPSVYNNIYSPRDPYFTSTATGHWHGDVVGDPIDVDAFTANGNPHAGVSLLDRVSVDKEVKLKAEAQHWLDALVPQLFNERGEQRREKEQQETMARAKEQIERIRLDNAARRAKERQEFQEKGRREKEARVRVKMEDDSSFFSANGFVEIHDVDASVSMLHAGNGQRDRGRFNGNYETQVHPAALPHSDSEVRQKTSIKVEQDDDWNVWGGLTLSRFVNTPDTAIVIDDDEHSVEDTGRQRESDLHMLEARHESDVDMEMSDTDHELRHEPSRSLRKESSHSETAIIKQEPEEVVLSSQPQGQAQVEMQVGWGFRPTAWDIFRNTPIEVDTPRQSEDPEETHAYTHTNNADSTAKTKTAKDGNFYTEFTQNSNLASNNDLEVGQNPRADARDDQLYPQKQDSRLVQRQLALENSVTSQIPTAEQEQDSVRVRMQDASSGSELVQHHSEGDGPTQETTSIRASKSRSVDRSQVKTRMEAGIRGFTEGTSPSYVRAMSESSIASSSASVIDSSEPEPTNGEGIIQEVPYAHSIKSPKNLNRIIPQEASGSLDSKRPDVEMTVKQSPVESTASTPASVPSSTSLLVQSQNPTPIPRPLPISQEEEEHFSIPGLSSTSTLIHIPGSSTLPQAPGLSTTILTDSNDQLPSEESSAGYLPPSASTDATFVNEDDEQSHNKSPNSDWRWHPDHITKDAISELYTKIIMSGVDLDKNGLAAMDGMGRWSSRANTPNPYQNGLADGMGRWSSRANTPNPYQNGLAGMDGMGRWSSGAITPNPYQAEGNPTFWQSSGTSTPNPYMQTDAFQPSGAITPNPYSAEIPALRSPHLSSGIVLKSAQPCESEPFSANGTNSRVPFSFNLRKMKRKQDDVELEERETRKEREKVDSVNDRNKESIENLLERQRGISDEYEQLQMEVVRVKKQQQQNAKGKQRAIEETDEDIPSKTRAWGARSPRARTRSDDWDYTDDRDANDYKLNYGDNEEKTENRQRHEKEPPKLGGRQREETVRYLQEELESVQRQLSRGLIRQGEILEKLKELGASETSMGVMAEIAKVGSPKKTKKVSADEEDGGQPSATDLAPGSDILMKTRLQLAEKKLEAEKRRRLRLENTLKEIEKECREPFVVPALLDAFVMISELSNGVSLRAETVDVGIKNAEEHGQSIAMDVT